MRYTHLFICFCFLLIASSSIAQSNQPLLGQTGPQGTTSAGTWATPPEVTVSGDVSYIRTYAPTAHYTDTAAINTSNQPNYIRQQTVYLDGFMRPFQTVTRNVSNVSGQGRSLIQFSDNRPLTNQSAFLPYAVNNSNLQTNTFQAQRDYYNNLYSSESYTPYYNGINTSDDNTRSTKSSIPGKSQVGQNRGTVTQLISNTVNEIIIWQLNDVGVPFASGYYAPLELIGQLKIMPTQNNNTPGVAPQSKEYIDKDGKVILKMVADGNNNNVVHWKYTYYIYDEKGNLRCTITPKAFKYYQDYNTLATGEVVNNLCFQYRYDEKGRLTAARNPGEEDFTTLVYDAKNRPVMRQTPNEKLAKEWEIIFYDAQNRVKATSAFIDNNQMAPAIWQATLDNAALNGATANTLPYFLGTPDGEKSYPPDNINSNEIRSYTYYDDYSIADPNNDEWMDLNSQLNFGEFLNSIGDEIPERSKRSYGLVTGSMVRILPAPDAAPQITGEWRKTLFFYDDKGRVVYSATTDLYQGQVIHTDLRGTQYDFANRIRVNKHFWFNTNDAAAQQKHSELTKYNYDAISGALASTMHKVDNGAWNTLNTFTYDDMGRAKRKSLGGGAEVQDMDYNIRGQLSGINRTYAELGIKENCSRSFGESIKYDYDFTKPRFDGKAAGMVWRGSNANQQLAYGYDYTQDQMLQSADFNYYTGVLWTKTALDYTVSGLSYDENGNVMAMNQRGTKPGVGPVDMDKLSYTYRANSNRTDEVTDNGGVFDYGAGDFQNNNPGASDYAYDPNGNLVKDANKGINNDITYTNFNKPVNIIMDNGNSFSYSYDASGNKVQEILNDADNGINTTTDYIGNAVYENNVLKYILTAEGRTTFDEQTATALQEEYFVKDHLGNVRSTINAVTYMPRQYLAEYEIASANLENLVFDNIDELREIKPGDGATMAARLNGADAATTVGSALMLHVMAGDKVSMKADDFYEYYDPYEDTPLSPEDMIANLITTLTGGFNGFEGSEGHNTELVNKAFSGNSNAYNDLISVNSNPSKPKAYLNYVVFDEDLNIVPEASGAFQATHEGGWGQIGTTEAMEMPVNGYIAVYLSNRSTRDIYFDRMDLRIIKGNLLEETHYYPHGLPIKGLGTSSDPGLMAQRRKYQSNEYIRSGLDWMSFGARQYDPQMGRFLGVDPLAAFGGQDMFSPYAAMGNMPEMMVDPNGMRFTPPTLDVAQAVGSGSDPMTNWKRAADPNSYGGSGGFGGGGGGGGFAPGFSSQGMSSTVLNTFWNILPPTMQEQAMIDYGSYGRQQQRIQDNNAVSNKFRELIYAIEDGTFNLSITRNSAFHYTINGTEIGAAKTKYVSNDNNNKDENTSDWMHWLGPGMIATGAEIVPKNLLPYIGLRGFVTPGATKFTSIASATLRATVPEWLPRLSWLPKAVSLGGQLGRAVPMVGWGVTVYDATYNGSFWLSDKIIQALPYNAEVKRNTSPSHWMMDAGVCFRQGTLVHTKVGLLKIETLKVGDSVFSYNLNTQMAELCRIDRTYKRITEEIYAVQIGSENVWVTQEHPFYVTGRGWVKVKDLKIGDKVKTSLGTELVLASNVYKKKMKVFNIEVAKNHDYFVTQSKILVHNKYIHSNDIFNVKSSEDKHSGLKIKFLLKRVLKIK